MDKMSITQIVNQKASGISASNRTFNDIYHELRKIARSHRRRWSGNDTLNTTAIIHEAYEKLAPLGGNYKNRKHFFATASKIMRQVLVNYAERSKADKRDATSMSTDTRDFPANNVGTLEELLTIDRLLKHMEVKSKRQCRIAECRIFGGMSINETAEALDISPSTIKREWTLLSTWLYYKLKAQKTDSEDDIQPIASKSISAR